MPRPIGIVTPGARNFIGASRNEIASTMPSQTKIAATATEEAVFMRDPFPHSLALLRSLLAGHS